MHQTTSTTLQWLSHVAGRKKIYLVLLLTLQALLGVCSVFYAVLLRALIDAAVAGERSDFFSAVLGLVLLLLSQLILRALNRFLEEYTRASMENCFKHRLFSFLLKEDYGRITALHSGEWMNRLTSDAVVVADGMAQIIPGVVGMLVRMLGALVMILVLEPRFGYLLIPGGLLLVVLTYGFRKVLKGYHKRMQEADGALRVFLQERLSSMLVVRAFVKEAEMLDEADRYMEAHKQARMKKNHFSNVCNVGFGGVMQGTYIIGAVVCGYGILTGTMSYGTLMAILQLIGQIQSPFANITGYLPRYYAMLASAERLREGELCAEKGWGRGTDTTERKPLPLAEVTCFYREQLRAICMEQVSFTYRPLSGQEKSQLPVVLENINLTIHKGEYVAVTGPSGCGKSTLLKLLLCLYPLDGGRCVWKVQDTVGAADPTDPERTLPFDAAYRRLFAYVPQGNHLMSGTIREIVAFADEAGMKQELRLWQALEIACAKVFVQELPQGLDTLLGEKGLGLSEGQMQRLAIARAIFAGNPVLMLDESTSALDEQTESRLLANLKAMTDKTVLIVTHRPAALEICDKVMEMNANRVAVRKHYGEAGKEEENDR